MKLKKVTKERTEPQKGKRRRWYEDACGTALALEFVGERWSLLILRELLLGPRRFSDIRAALPGLSANILTQRLEGLEESGILVKRKLPPPANAQVYELTRWGYETEPIFQVMGRWAVRSPEHDPSLGLSPASMMLSLRTMQKLERVKDFRARIGFVLGGDAFVGEMDEEGIEIRRGTPEDADFTFVAASPLTLAGIVYGKRPIEDAEAAGDLEFHGDRALAARFVTLFDLPPKWNAD